MTENTNVTEAGLQNQTSQTTSQVPVTPVQNAPTKIYDDNDVNRIVGTKVQKGYEKGKADALAEWQQQNATTQQSTISTGQPANASTSQTDFERIARQQVEQIYQEKEQQLTQQRYQQQAVEIAAQIESKLADSKARYEDFEKVVTPQALNAHAEIMLLANSLENTGDIAYDILKNPGKGAVIHSYLTQAKITGNPYFQQQALNLLRDASESIKANQQAVKNQPHVNEPLSQIRSSNTGADNGKATLRDLKAQDWLRG